MIRSSSQKHLGIRLDKKLNFIHNIKENNSKANKGVGVIKKLNDTLPMILYGDIIYDHPNNESFCSKLETVQYNAALVITGSIWGTIRP